jgi:hypothetical protein
MKNIVRTLTFAAAVVFASIHQTAHAQGRVEFLRAQVPFAFDSGTTKMAAGTYTIEIQNARMLLLRGNGRASMTTANTEDIRSTSKKNCLVFLKIGDHYVLDQVWTAGADSYLQLSHSKSRILKLKELAAKDAEPTRMELALDSTGNFSSGN